MFFCFFIAMIYFICYYLAHKGVIIINERIKQIRKSFNMNQTDFGARIGVKQGSVAGYESGSRTPVDAVILSICREFDINEEWLRTGNGEMKLISSEDDEVMKYVGMLLKDKEDFIAQKIKRFIVGYEKLDANDKRVVESLMRQIFTDEHMVEETSVLNSERKIAD